jgi:hypothetical protein
MLRCVLEHIFDAGFVISFLALSSLFSCRSHNVDTEPDCTRGFTGHFRAHVLQRDAASKFFYLGALREHGRQRPAKFSSQMLRRDWIGPARWIHLHLSHSLLRVFMFLLRITNICRS